MQIHITIDGAAAEQMFNQIALKHSVALAAAVQAAQQQTPAAPEEKPVEHRIVVGPTETVIGSKKPFTIELTGGDPLPPSDNVGAEKLVEPEKPAKAKSTRAAKGKEPEEPAKIDAVACREALKKVAAKAGQGDAAGGVGKVEELLQQFDAQRISDLKPDQLTPFHDACMAYVNAK